MKDKARWFFANFEEVMGALIIALMTFFAFLNVLTRYLIKFSFAPSEEIEVNALVWITMFGAAAAFKRNSHLRLTFLKRYLGEKVFRVFRLSGGILGVAVFSIIIWFAIRQAMDEKELGIISEALSVPQWIYTLLLPAMCLLVIIRIVQSMTREFRTEGRP